MIEPQDSDNPSYWRIRLNDEELRQSTDSTRGRLLVYTQFRDTEINMTRGFYLVNASDEILSSVTTESGGAFLQREEAPSPITASKQFIHRDVKPAEAVLLDLLDLIYDDDSYLEVVASFEGPSLGKHSFSCRIYRLREQGVGYTLYENELKKVTSF